MKKQKTKKNEKKQFTENTDREKIITLYAFFDLYDYSIDLM